MILRRLSGTGEGDGGDVPPVSDAELMDEVANTIRDLLAVIRTGADHGRIVCVGDSSRTASREERKAARKAARKRRPPQSQESDATQ